MDRKIPFNITWREVDGKIQRFDIKKGGEMNFSEFSESFDGEDDTAALREIFDFLYASMSGELYTAEAVDEMMRKLNENRKIPFNITWAEHKLYTAEGVDGLRSRDGEDDTVFSNQICFEVPEINMASNIVLDARVSVVTVAKLVDVSVKGGCKCP